ncbi:MAG: peptidoglycan-binding protein [Bryobacterales bacterium]|nr:peptidoglycan-binding protein [Bryobacterales bacterium]
MPTLRNGDDSPWVGEVQTRLKELGHFKGKPDNDFGSITENAVRAFQSKKMLVVNGQVDSATADALGLPHLIGKLAAATAESVALLFPGTRFENVTVNLPFVTAGLLKAGLKDKKMLLMAMGTIRAETAMFLPVSEGVSQFNTSAGGKPFDLYDKRKDLGNQGSPDGDRFKGRGYIQLTGRDNYSAIGKSLGLKTLLTDDPEKANDPGIAGSILAFFLKRVEKNVRVALEKNDLGAARKLVNGGSHGLNPFRTAFLRGEEIYADSLQLL